MTKTDVIAISTSNGITEPTTQIKNQELPKKLSALLLESVFMSLWLGDRGLTVDPSVTLFSWDVAVFCGFSVGFAMQPMPFSAKVKFGAQAHLKLPKVFRQVCSHGLCRHSSLSIHVPPASGDAPYPA